MSDRVYTIMTDLDPQTLSRVGLAILDKWVEFALGKTMLGPFKLNHPTGKYASSIKARQFGMNRVVITQNEKMAPEGIFLEEGHVAVDLKKKFEAGRRYPMHRKNRQFTGFSTAVPSEITAENADSWIIPEMKAYSPAAHLVDLFREEFKRK